MKRKSGRVINRQWVRSELISAIMIALGIWSVLTPEDGDSWLSWLILLIGMVLLAAIFLLLPHFCYVDTDGICIAYAFGKQEAAAWQKIQKIVCSWDHSLYPWETEYQFIGLSGGKFYMRGVFIKSRKLTRLLAACGADKLIEKE